MNSEIAKQENQMQVNPETLIMSAIEKGLPVETMERLLAMRRELMQEKAREEFFKSLADFQNKCPTIEKTKPVKNNKGEIKYHYAPLEDIIKQVKTILDENGFSYTYKTLYPEGRITVICEVHHVGGHTEVTDITVPIGSDYMSAQQQVGAALSFAKRYAFCDAFGILTGDEDDDCQPVVNENKQNQPVKPKPEPKQINPYNQAAIKQVEDWINKKLYNPKNLAADIKLAMKKFHIAERVVMSEMTKEQIDEVLKVIKVEVKKNDLIEGTEFDAEPVKPNFDSMHFNTPQDEERFKDETMKGE